LKNSKLGWKPSGGTMKRMRILLVVAVLTISFATTIAQANDLGKILEFGVGSILGVATHELGHETLAKLNGEHLSWSTNGFMPYWQSELTRLKKADGQWRYHQISYPENGAIRVNGFYYFADDPSDIPSETEKAKAHDMLLGGFIAQTATSEILLKNKRLHKSAFLKGWLACNVLYGLFYQSNRFASVDGKGDINKLKTISGSKSNKSETILIGHAIFTAWRYYHPKQTKLVPDVNLSKQGLNMEWSFKF